MLQMAVTCASKSKAMMHCQSIHSVHPRVNVHVDNFSEKPWAEKKKKKKNLVIMPAVTQQFCAVQLGSTFPSALKGSEIRNMHPDAGFILFSIKSLQPCILQAVCRKISNPCAHHHCSCYPSLLSESSCVAPIFEERSTSDLLSLLLRAFVFSGSSETRFWANSVLSMVRSSTAERAPVQAGL